ncbi:MAG: c-type cytochrome [Acidimicrobiia bacterium]|nr:c-type cytochrome [Acidimicrobiia bacterium]
MSTQNRRPAPKPGRREWLRWLPVRLAVVGLLGLAAVIGVLIPITRTGAAEPGTHRTVRSGSGVQVQPETEVAFARQCAGCHGGGGEGAFGPDLRTWAGSTEETALLIGGGADGMPSFAATLTQDQIDALAVYLDELVGVSVYREHCAQCHGDSGEGNSGPSLKTSTRDEAGSRSLIADGLGSMPGFSTTLTDVEIDALVQRAAGYAVVGPTIFADQCAACHGALGEGLTGPALAGLTDTDATAVVESGFGGMPAFGPTLEPGDIEAVVQHALSLDSTTTTTPATTTIPPSTTTTVTVEISGAEGYAQRCAVCHGSDAEGGSGPTLAGTVLSAEALSALILDGKGSMPGFAGTISEEEIAAIVAFVEALAEPSSTEPTEQGAEVYAEQCAACHGADGRGGLGPSLRTTLLAGTDLRDAIARGNATMPAFATTLETEDLELIARYVEGLQATIELDEPDNDFEGAVAMYRQDCSACHGARGEGGIGPELQGTTLTVNDIIARVYGGHSAGMPAFEGALNSRQVTDVAQYIKTFEASSEDKSGLGVGALVAIAGGVLLVAAAALIVVRVRRRAT